MNNPIRDILNEFRQSSIIIHAQGSVLGVDEDVRAFASTIDEAYQAIKEWAEQETLKARAEERQSIVDELGKMHEIQGMNGTWNYDPYMHGMYNGMEFCTSLVKGVEPKYREAPPQWIADIKTKNASNLGMATQTKLTKASAL